MDPIVERLAVEEFMRLVKFPDEEKFGELALAVGADPERVKKEAKRLGLLVLPTTVDKAITALRGALRAIGKPVPITEQPVGAAEWNWGPHSSEINEILQLVTNHEILLMCGTSPDYDGYVGCSPHVHVGSEMQENPRHDEFMRRVIEAKKAELDALVASRPRTRASAAAERTEEGPSGETPSKRPRER